MNYPLISIVIVTRNSEKTLPKTLESIKKQRYPKEKLEVLVIDGGSIDKTREIVKKFRFRLIDNPQLGFVPGKHLGYLIAKGRFLMYLHSDEEIANPDSLRITILTFQSDKKIKGVIGTGYKNPVKSVSISHYLNELGDPFSYFIYRSTMNYKFFLKDFYRKYQKVAEDKNFIVFDFSSTESLPLLEFVEMGGVIDLNYFKKTFPQIKNNPTLIAHFLYLLTTKKAFIAITKNDPIIHYSVDSIKKYLNKISWRVRNNIYSKDKLALSGFEGRERLKSNYLKKYLFIPYSLTLIFPIVDAIYLSITRKDMIFLIHPLLCIYTSLYIIYHYIMYSLNRKPNLKTYGN